jgi:hypothetical protein
MVAAAVVVEVERERVWQRPSSRFEPAVVEGGVGPGTPVGWTGVMGVSAGMQIFLHPLVVGGTTGELVGISRLPECKWLPPMFHMH